MKKTKTHKLSLIFIALIGSSQAAEPVYLLKITDKPLTQQTSKWKDTTSVYGEWSNVGQPYNCEPWSPNPGEILFGENFTQSRSCTQVQSRSKTSQQINVITKETRTGVTTSESRAVSRALSQQATGQKDAVSSERESPWAEWKKAGEPFDCATWSPASDDIQLYEQFTQSRTCSQPQLRTRDVFSVWLSGKETRQRTESESSVGFVTESRDAEGSADFVFSTKISPWTAWVDQGEPTDCSNYSPAASTQQTNFQQSKSCKQSQQRTRDFFDVWRSGKETFNHQQSDVQDVVLSFDRQVSVQYTPWQDIGTPSGCSAWMPQESSVNLGQQFTQSRNCSQNTQRLRKYSSGESFDENSARALTEDKLTAGTKNYIVSEESSDWSAWTNSGGVYDCTTWSPDPSTVNKGVSFQQSATCSQAQTQSRTISDVWADGTKTFQRTVHNNQVVPNLVTRTAIGTKSTAPICDHTLSVTQTGILWLDGYEEVYAEYSYGYVSMQRWNRVNMPDGSLGDTFHRWSEGVFDPRYYEGKLISGGMVGYTAVYQLCRAP